MSDSIDPDSQTVTVRVQVIDMESFTLDLRVPNYLPARDLTQRIARDAGLEAHWADGTEVTAHDVHATWKMRMDPTLLEPSSVVTYGKMNEPEVLSKYMLKVTVNEESWKNFLYFSGMAILPASDIASAGEPGDDRGKAYLDEYNFKFTMSCGPYEVRDEDIKTGKSISMRRREDWWAIDLMAVDVV